MVVLKLHSSGAREYLEVLKEKFETFKKKLNNDSKLSTFERELVIAKAKENYLKEKKALKQKLF